MVGRGWRVLGGDLGLLKGAFGGSSRVKDFLEVCEVP